MRHAAERLDELGVPYEAKIVSAHRTPDRLTAFAKGARDAGYKVVIAGAGGAAHLPGMVAAMTTLPVLGVPIETGALKGEDSLYSIVQMPAGIPVGTLAIGMAAGADRGGGGTTGGRRWLRPCRRAPQSGSSAAASSGACWRWRRPASVSAAMSIAPTRQAPRST
jgi:hypothetical protein